MTGGDNTNLKDAENKLMLDMMATAENRKKNDFIFSDYAVIRAT